MAQGLISCIHKRQIGVMWTLNSIYNRLLLPILYMKGYLPIYVYIKKNLLIPLVTSILYITLCTQSTILFDWGFLTFIKTVFLEKCFIKCKKDILIQIQCQTHLCVNLGILITIFGWRVVFYWNNFYLCYPHSPHKPRQYITMEIV